MDPSGIDANEFVTHRSSGPVRRIDFRHYALSVLSPSVALGTSLFLQHFHFRVPSALLFLLAVTISSWYGGLGPAVLAVILSTIGFYWYFVEPARTIYIYWSEVPYFIIFAAFAAVLSWFARVRRRGEADLREQAAVLNLTHDSIFVMKMDGVIKYWNRGAEERYGWTAAQAMGKVAHDLLKTIFPAPLDEIKAKVTRTGRWEGELVHTKKDGSQLVASSRWALERGKRGQPVAILETNNDITERKRAEEELRQTAWELRQLVDVIPQQVFAFDAAWSPVFANRRELEYTGLTPHDMQSKDAVARVFYPEDLSKLEAARERARCDSAPFEMEARIRGKAGGYRWFLIRDNPLRDEQGHVLRWYGTRTDIEDRKRAEEALRRSEAYLAEAQSLSHTGSWAFDISTREMIHTSAELSRLYGFDPEAETPSSGELIQSIHPEDQAPALEALESASWVGKDFEYQYRIVLPNGTTRHVYGTAHRVFNSSGNVTEIMGIVMDITERKRAEEERARLHRLEADLAQINRVSVLGELTASIAHEVNQPLSGIVSNGSACLRWLAGDSPNLEETREAVLDIVRDGKRAGEIVARIRALTKRTPATREKLDLNETIREVLALVGDEARRSRVMVRTLFANDLSAVAGDRVQLQQVVLNLVMNAIEAMSGIGERARELVITTRNIDANQVQVTVEDSGIGLDPNTIDKIFDSFYTTKPSGMGMGLSISRSILQAHGGRLWATAKASPGTMFHFTIPKYHEERAHAGAK